MTTPTELPARILLQVREGVLNTLVEFDIPVHSTEPSPADSESTLTHEIGTLQIIRGLAFAMRDQVLYLRENEPEDTDDTEYLSTLLAWVVAP